MSSRFVGSSVRSLRTFSEKVSWTRVTVAVLVCQGKGAVLKLVLGNLAARKIPICSSEGEEEDGDDEGDDGDGNADGDGLDGGEVRAHGVFFERGLVRVQGRRRGGGGVGGGVGGAVVDGYGRFGSDDVIGYVMQWWKVPSSSGGVSLLGVEGVKSEEGEDK
ncbi:hypothetical protein EDD85DRAFT_786835 [Armillaria nabsnona]|nr:hypothetical protein EDD85DRAFT_786835 [Armillaria nabsnona]